MNDIDHKIQEALRAAGGADWAREPNVAEELLGAFRARNRWLHGVTFAFTFAFFVAAVVAGVQCALAESAREQILWGLLCLVGMACVGFLKLYFWMELHTNRVLRELKRVELLILQSRSGTPT